MLLLLVLLLWLLVVLGDTNSTGKALRGDRNLILVVFLEGEAIGKVDFECFCFKRREKNKTLIMMSFPIMNHRARVGDVCVGGEVGDFESPFSIK